MQFEQFKEVLRGEQQKLEGELKGIGRINPRNPKDWEPVPEGQGETASDPLDIAERTTEFDTNASIVADLETRLNEVTEALGRIEKGAYGTCVVGGEPIEEKRLLADPAARTCLKHLNQ